METIKQILAIIDTYDKQEELLKQERRKHIGTLLNRAVKAGVINNE